MYCLFDVLVHVYECMCVSVCVCVGGWVWVGGWVGVGGWVREIGTASGALETIISSKSCQFVCKLWNFVTPFTCNVSCNTMKEFS